MRKLLVVDDNADVRLQLSEILTTAGYYTDNAANAREAIDKATIDSFDVILMDAVMPGMKGIDAIKEIKQIRPKTKIIIITAFASIEDAIEAIKQGASDYLSKPFKIKTLLNIIKREIGETTFEKEISSVDMDFILSTISNPLRRKLLKLVNHQSMRFMELNRELSLIDHTRLVFHLRLLKDCGLIAQDATRAYVLTDRGIRVYKGIMILETFLVTNS
ncbi:response regulator receiver protein [Candidatus Magnetobacterium bavaricum]|uniref:Response regulator receiver protein n=1 Tax=Candidatus Magnetobacterium bavaricum TaxID=29290 RepID=A0A0F3GTP3_9BACT|nr:response regulator receiver protein [Candidatus Magnetobacterium bavaricum]